MIRFCHILCSRNHPPCSMTEPDTVDHQCIKQLKCVKKYIRLYESCPKCILLIHSTGNHNTQHDHSNQSNNFVPFRICIHLFLCRNSSLNCTFLNCRRIIIKLLPCPLHFEQPQHENRIYQTINNCFYYYLCCHLIHFSLPSLYFSSCITI